MINIEKITGEGGQEIQSVKIKIQEMNPEARVEADFWESIPASVFRYGPRNSNIFKLEMEAAVSMKPVRIRSCREPSVEPVLSGVTSPGMSFLLLLLSGKNPLRRSGWGKRFCML